MNYIAIFVYSQRTFAKSFSFISMYFVIFCYYELVIQLVFIIKNAFMKSFTPRYFLVQTPFHKSIVTFIFSFNDIFLIFICNTL